ncbi:hypothetical protein EV714DRAFT_271557 [Schizophyllum commune]
MTIAKAQDNVDKAVAESISIQQADRLCADVEKWDSFCTSFAALASRVVEEPISPVCDVFAGLRIPGILGADTLEEQRRNAAFNIIGSYEQWAKATVPMSGTEEVYQRQLAMAQEYPRSPFARDGVPDEKDVLELIRERYEAKSSPVTFDPLTVAKQVKEQLSTITTSRKGRNQDEGNPRVESKMVSKTDDQSARHPTPGMESISTHLQRGRSGNNSDGSGSGSPGSDSDRSLAALFTEEEEEELVKVLTRLNPAWSSLKEGDNFHLQDLIIPVLLVEHKRLAVKNWSEQGLNQLLIYMVSAVQLLATIGIYNMPVYGLVTDGPVGVVLTAWGVRTECTPLPFKIMIADKNAPTFDITNPIQALRFASFLIRLRLEHVPKLYRAFEDIKDKFMNDWRDPNKAANFQWRSADQKRMDAISEFEKVRDECLQKARDVLKKAHEAKASATSLGSSIKPLTSSLGLKRALTSNSKYSLEMSQSYASLKSIPSVPSVPKHVRDEVLAYAIRPCSSIPPPVTSNALSDNDTQTRVQPSWEDDDLQTVGGVPATPPAEALPYHLRPDHGHVGCGPSLKFSPANEQIKSKPMSDEDVEMPAALDGPTRTTSNSTSDRVLDSQFSDATRKVSEEMNKRLRVSTARCSEVAPGRALRRTSIGRKFDEAPAAEFAKMESVKDVADWRAAAKKKKKEEEVTPPAPMSG